MAGQWSGTEPMTARGLVLRGRTTTAKGAVTPTEATGALTSRSWTITGTRPVFRLRRSRRFGIGRSSGSGWGW